MKLNEADIPTADQLVDELNRLEVHFLQGGTGCPVTEPLEPAILLAMLATSNEARLQLALLPLLLRHPDFAHVVCQVAEQLPPPTQVVLKCYYTAAQLLQQKYCMRIQTLFGYSTVLPNLFMAELGLPTFFNPDHGLQMLAERHRLLSGRAINWLGTYEHGAQRLLTHCERRQLWRKSQPIKSEPC